MLFARVPLLILGTRDATRKRWLRLRRKGLKQLPQSDVVHVLCATKPGNEQFIAMRIRIR